MEKLVHFSESFQGLSHRENQDGYLVIEEEEYTIFAVFDGVSRALNPRNGVDSAIQFLNEHHQDYVSSDSLNLNQMMFSVHQNILQTNIPESLTTYAIAGFFNRNSSLWFYSSLGDSRIYRLREHTLTCITTDDTLWPGSPILTKCLGSELLSVNDFQEGKFIAGEGFLFLATDGCYLLCEEKSTELTKAFEKDDVLTLNKTVIRMLKGNNLDDATYILIKPPAYKGDLSKFSIQDNEK